MSSSPPRTPDGESLWSTGVPVVRKFPFSYNTPGLLTGATVYTPTIGDLLVGAWFEINTPWDGTTPLGEVGQFIDTNLGLFAYDTINAADMTVGNTLTARPGMNLPSTAQQVGA